jgi:hypothetical protein
MGSKENGLPRKRDPLLARLMRGSQPGRARSAGKRFSKEYQPARRGRRKGSRNLISRDIKEAILAAAKAVGEDGKGKNGLVGYMVTLAREEPRLMATLLHRVMQMQGGVERIEPKVVYESLDQVRAELAKYGIVASDLSRIELETDESQPPTARS